MADFETLTCYYSSVVPGIQLKFLHGLNYKVSSFTKRKFGSVVFCFLSLTLSAIFNQSVCCYVVTTMIRLNHFKTI